jgi:serine/threonine protein kinase
MLHVEEAADTWRLLQGTPLDEDEARRLFQAMASALAYTSALGLAHHDLKLDNFLLHQVCADITHTCSCVVHG